MSELDQFHHIHCKKCYKPLPRPEIEQGVTVCNNGYLCNQCNKADRNTRPNDAKKMIAEYIDNTDDIGILSRDVGEHTINRISVYDIRDVLEALAKFCKQSSVEIEGEE